MTSDHSAAYKAFSEDYDNLPAQLRAEFQRKFLSVFGWEFYSAWALSYLDRAVSALKA